MTNTNILIVIVLILVVIVGWTSMLSYNKISKIEKALAVDAQRLMDYAKQSAQPTNGNTITTGQLSDALRKKLSDSNLDNLSEVNVKFNG